MVDLIKAVRAGARALVNQTMPSETVDETPRPMLALIVARLLEPLERCTPQPIKAMASDFVRDKSHSELLFLCALLIAGGFVGYHFKETGKSGRASPAASASSASAVIESPIQTRRREPSPAPTSQSPQSPRHSFFPRTHAHAKKSSPASAGGGGGRDGESPGRSACHPSTPNAHAKQPILDKTPSADGDADLDRRISSLERSEFHFDFDGDVPTAAADDVPGGGRPGMVRSRSFVGFKQGEKETIRKGASLSFSIFFHRRRH